MLAKEATTKKDRQNVVKQFIKLGFPKRIAKDFLQVVQIRHD